MKHYVKRNVTREAAAAAKYTIKMLAQSSEIVVFMFLGMSAVSSTLVWDLTFIAVILVACTVSRVITVVAQCYIVNQFRKRRFSFRDQFVMAYGGLRGTIAFGLLSNIPEEIDEKVRGMFTSATIAVVCFTVFLQVCLSR